MNKLKSPISLYAELRKRVKDKGRGATKYPGSDFLPHGSWIELMWYCIIFAKASRNTIIRQEMHITLKYHKYHRVNFFTFSQPPPHINACNLKQMLKLQKFQSLNISKSFTSSSRNYISYCEMKVQKYAFFLVYSESVFHSKSSIIPIQSTR